MKRSFLMVGASFGFLTSLALMAISYLANLLVGLPFLPFDLFDWLTRHLPGAVIETGIRSMLAVITALHLGPTASTAKLAEQMQSLLIVAVTGVVFGLVMGWIASTRRNWLGSAGVVGGVLLWLGMVLPETSMTQSTSNLLLGLIWLLALLLGWGWILNRSLDGYAADTANSTAATESETPGRAPVLTARGSYTRRNFLLAVASGMGGFIVLALGLEKYHQDKVPNPGQVKVPNAVASPAFANYNQPYGPEYTSGPAASPSPAVLANRFDAAPGTRPEVVAAKDFYRIDIDTLPPVIDGAAWTLALSGLVNNPASLTLDNILNHASITQAVTLSCISNPVGGDLIGNNFWTGVPFKNILAEADLQPNAAYISFMSADGFYESMAVAEAMDERVLLVYAMNGQILLPEHGFPLRIYIPNHYGMKQPKWLTQITLTEKPGPGYWVDRGWDKDAFPLTTSVIDTQTVSKSSITADGLLPLGGIAWSGGRGIRKVEVQTDGGAWVPVRLRTPPLGTLTWVDWRYDWKASPGLHTFKVRATDGAGVLQNDHDSGPGPSGATGLHSVRISL